MVIKSSYQAVPARTMMMAHADGPENRRFSIAPVHAGNEVMEAAIGFPSRD